MLRYSSEYRVSRQSDKTIGRSNTFVNYFAKPLDCHAIITRRHNFSSTSCKQIALEKKIISIYETDKYLFFSSFQNERFLVPSIRYWMNSSTNLFNKLHEILFRRDSRSRRKTLFNTISTEKIIINSQLSRISDIFAPLHSNNSITSLHFDRLYSKNIETCTRSDFLR